jgi:hypothetical protein
LTRHAGLSGDGPRNSEPCYAGERAELAWAIHANQGRISRLRASDAAHGSLWFAGRLPEHGDSVRDLKRFAHRSAPVQLIHLAVAPALHGLLGATDPTEGLPVRFFRAPYTLVYIAFPRPAGLMQVYPGLTRRFARHAAVLEQTYGPMTKRSNASASEPGLPVSKA